MKYLSLLVIMLFTVSCGMQSIPTALNQVDADWAEVQNQYKRRQDLIPNLVEVVKGYAKHEKETLEGVVSARAKATQVNFTADQLNAENLKKFQEAQSGLSSALSRLMVVVEKYPDLKANQNFRDLQAQLEGTENRITVARNRYIAAIQNFNNLVTVPPTSWYNSIFLKHEKKPQFAVENIERAQEAPAVKF
ncbi:LemA family protein [Bacteriovorax stolpii]|uniref:LemA family protein n=1 Tax=Bacteriovorax stolpii TaxID=960 RepID=A0A2K9NRZ9_BACTC|nr:LemA family protein [Bacteriovorax stolpii]AUN98291.1 LemA family protein [Bacteriovorax stolpii]QDK41729.1 LemA family protein [Bacteriovorax stolpii]TDP52215.1 LemA protein [Bacteriovorax stolpii]